MAAMEGREWEFTWRNRRAGEIEFSDLRFGKRGGFGFRALR
jgi:hypothetical protein